MESNAPKPMNAAVRCEDCRVFDSDCYYCRSRRMKQILGTMERPQQLLYLQREKVTETFIKDETGSIDYPVDLVSDAEDDDLLALDELRDADAALDDESDDDDDKNHHRGLLHRDLNQEDEEEGSSHLQTLHVCLYSLQVQSGQHARAVCTPSLGERQAFILVILTCTLCITLSFTETMARTKQQPKEEEPKAKKNFRTKTPAPKAKKAKRGKFLSLYSKATANVLKTKDDFVKLAETLKWL